MRFSSHPRTSKVTSVVFILPPRTAFLKGFQWAFSVPSNMDNHIGMLWHPCTAWPSECWSRPGWWDIHSAVTYIIAMHNNFTEEQSNCHISSSSDPNSYCLATGCYKSSCFGSQSHGKFIMSCHHLPPCHQMSSHKIPYKKRGFCIVLLLKNCKC